MGLCINLESYLTFLIIRKNGLIGIQTLNEKHSLKSIRIPTPYWIKQRNGPCILKERVLTVRNYGHRFQ